MKISTLSLFALAVAASPEPAAAEPDAPPHRLVELFVSQNCGNCPGAMRLVREESATRDHVFVLTYSVDYWDYLGWTDTFAQPAFAERQRAYARTLSLRGPYTPMMVADGQKDCVGNRTDLVERLMDAPGAGRAVIDLSWTPGTDDTLPGIEVASHDVEVRVERIDYVEGLRTVIPDRGPNRSTDLVHQNVVLGVRELDVLALGERAQFALECETACAVLVRDATSGDVLGFIANAAG